MRRRRGRTERGGLGKVDEEDVKGAKTVQEVKDVFLLLQEGEKLGIIIIHLLPSLFWPALCALRPSA